VSSKTINLPTALIVPAGQKVRLTVVFEALDSIQSSVTAGLNDLAATWTVALTDFRYQDATGVVVTNQPTGINALLSFQSSTANDTLNLQTSTLNPSNFNAKVKTSAISDEVLAFAFKLKAGTDSSNLDVTQIPIQVVATNPAGGVAAPTLGDIINDIYLKAASSSMIYDNYTTEYYTDGTFATPTGSSGTVPSLFAIYTFNIDSGDLPITTGNYVDMQMFTKYGSENNKYDSGTTVTPTIAASTIAVENSAGDTVATPTNAMTGPIVTLIVNGASVTYVSDAFTAYDQSNGVDGTISMTFRVSNFGDQDVTIAEVQTNNHAAGSGIVVYDVSGATEHGDGIVTSSEVTPTGTTPNRLFTVSAGDTTGKVFTIAQKFNTPSGFIRLAITNVDQTAVTNVQTAAH
jgi:predicted secreted protein